MTLHDPSWLDGPDDPDDIDWRCTCRAGNQFDCICPRPEDEDDGPWDGGTCPSCGFEGRDLEYIGKDVCGDCEEESRELAEAVTR